MRGHKRKLMMACRNANIRKLLLASMLFTASFLIIIVIRSSDSQVDDRDRKLRLEKIDEFIKDQANSQQCKQPDLPVKSPEMMKFVKEEPQIDCKGAGVDWVVCKGSECNIQEHAKLLYGSIKCSFTDLIRVDDFHIKEGQTVNTDSTYVLQKTDVVKVSCKSAQSKWSAVLTGIRIEKEIWDRINWEYFPKNMFNLNVLMFGFDSLSRNSFIRKLPKSYKYLTEVLRGHVLQGYNIVGDGTPQALIPILTGKTELELPDTRKRIPNSNFVNVYPFIWKDFKEAGYVTAFFEDLPEQGTFTYRLKGFNLPPTDHYMRPYYIAANALNRRWPKLCSGSIPRHKVMMNHIENFFNVYKSKPKFLFGFHGELSHDSYNLIGVADNDLLQMLKNLHDSRVLNDTILIIMADHGHRFAEIRNTIQGKLEERMPFFSFVFPEWFSRKYQKEYDNFRENVERLTTPFDIYSTLKTVLNRNVINTGNRSISLFAEISADRNCAQAYIEPHWCACLNWQPISLSNTIVNRLGQTLVNALNNYTNSHRHLCEVLSLSKIFWASRMTPSENLLKFKKNADIDGFIPDMSAKMKVKTEVYQIKAMLAPGNSLFEASITHLRDRDEMILNLGDISRINMYRNQAKCIEDSFPNLRKYCYCRD